MPARNAVKETVPADGAIAAKDATAGTDKDFITMPHGDLTVSEGKVVQWLKQAGETFVAGEIVAELETDKALLEIEAPAAGRLSEILAPVGTTVSMGGALATFVKL